MSVHEMMIDCHSPSLPMSWLSYDTLLDPNLTARKGASGCSVVGQENKPSERFGEICLF